MIERSRYGAESLDVDDEEEAEWAHVLHDKFYLESCSDVLKESVCGGAQHHVVNVEQ